MMKLKALYFKMVLSLFRYHKDAVAVTQVNRSMAVVCSLRLALYTERLNWILLHY